MYTTGSSFGNSNGTWQSLKNRFFPGGGPLRFIRTQNEVVFVFRFFFLQAAGHALGLGIYVVGFDLVTTLCRKEIQ